MDNDKLLNTFDDPNAIPGIIQKTASVSPLECTDDDLAKINQFALTPLKAEDVYTFKAVMADNEQDDRNNMPFDLKALQDLKELYPGKTVLKDHDRMADNQIARIYDTELVSDSSKLTDIGEVHTELVAKVYMVKTSSNADLIKEIQAGIKKEVSTSCMPAKMVCNICGTDNLSKWCKHYPGREYDAKDAEGNKVKKRCKMLLSGAKEAYELSLVAVPAQPRAGATKSYGFTKPIKEPDTDPVVDNIDEKSKELDDRLTGLRYKALSSIKRGK